MLEKNGRGDDREGQNTPRERGKIPKVKRVQIQVQSVGLGSLAKPGVDWQGFWAGKGLH